MIFFSHFRTPSYFPSLSLIDFYHEILIPLNKLNTNKTNEHFVRHKRSIFLKYSNNKGEMIIAWQDNHCQNETKSKAKHNY